MTKDVISLSVSVLLLFRHYISHKITFGAPAVAGYYAVLAVLLLIFCGNPALLFLHQERKGVDIHRQASYKFNPSLNGYFGKQ